MKYLQLLCRSDQKILPHYILWEQASCQSHLRSRFFASNVILNSKEKFNKHKDVQDNPSSHAGTEIGPSKEHVGNMPMAPYKEDPATQRIQISKSRRKWIDSLRIACHGGNGGHGLPKYGGMGGKGGDCVLECTTKPKETPNLYQMFKTRFKGDSKLQKIKGGRGQDSRKYCILGPYGENATLQVPMGIQVVNDDGKLLFDLDEPGKKVIVASGGQGGGPTNNFLGSRGEIKYVRLELKLMADIGLVGFPNAGKSTLLKAISRARPKIANYPFTTITPNLGHLAFEDERVITMADLPGLIEGAHYNIGMGHTFLKHVERTKLLLVVVDVNGFRLGYGSPFRSAFESVILLNRELELYNADLLQKPCICVLNKMDHDNAKENLEVFEHAWNHAYESACQMLGEDLKPKQRFQFDEILTMSAKYSPKTVQELKQRLRHWIDVHNDQTSNEVRDELKHEIMISLNEKGPLLS